MRVVPIKAVEQQSILMAHRAGLLLVCQRTMLANAFRAHLAELGLVANPGIAGETGSASAVGREWLPSYARTTLEALVPQIHDASRGDHGVGSQALPVACRQRGQSPARCDPRPWHFHSNSRHRSRPVPVRQKICCLAGTDGGLTRDR
jgi:hypothetical protein